MPDKCIFCEIAEKKIPAKTVYEDENFIAFLDIHPMNPGHTLVAPKKHYQWTWEVPEFGKYFEVARTVALAAMKSLNSKIVNFITAGLGVPHAHIHVVPRFENDGHGELPTFTQTKTLTDEQLNEIAEKIRSAVPEFLPKEENPAEEKEPERSPEEIEWIKRQAGLE